MFGRNTSTLPTPAMTPSTTRSLNQPSFIKLPTKSPNFPTSQSIQSIGYCPTANVAQNTIYNIATKIGNAAQRLVTMASSLSVSERLGRSSRCFSYTSASAPRMNAYLASTIADSGLLPSRASMRAFSSRRAAASSSATGNAPRTASMSLSPSRYLMAR